MTIQSPSRKSNLHDQNAGHGRLPDRAAALAAAEKLLPAIRERAAAAEETRCVPDETIRDLRQSGLFGVVTPRVFGGAELGFATLVQVTSKIASACGSTGWVYGVLAGHSWLLNLFPVEAQREVFADPDSLLATVFRLNGDISRVSGGYRLVNGQGRFCSGIDHADYIIVGGAIPSGDGVSESRFFVIPRKEVEIIDDWHTAGMRGTGSKSIRIAEAFIPEHRSCALDDMVAGTSPGSYFHQQPLYRVSFSNVAPFSIIGAPLGMARAALHYYRADMSSRLGKMNDSQKLTYSTTLARYAAAEAAVDSALSLVVGDAAQLDILNEDNPLPADRDKFGRNWAYAVQTARDAVNSLFSAAGGSSIYNSSELQRCWRDMNSASQHGAFGWDLAMTRYGQFAAGFSSEGFALTGG